ncbi:MAG TPA: GNAT family N-acetyltransferase [Thermoproteota archaeon]|nr:GNAT family N-acetyltransferase [Thermoproteota archaeon]
MVELRELRRNDLKEVRTLANHCLNRDTISDASLERITFGDPNFAPELAEVALERNEIVGCMIGVRRTQSPPESVELQKEVGWIKLFFVSDGYRRRTIASQMLIDLEKKFISEGTERIRVADFAGWTLFSGVDLMYQGGVGFLLSKGFKKVEETVDYEIDLLDLYVPEVVATAEGRLSDVTVRKAELSERERFTKWAVEMFSPFWGFEVSETFKFDPPRLWIAEKDGKTLGFSVYGALEPHWFGPIGVDPDSRKHGLGSVLLFKALASMREEGQRVAVIPWTEHLFFYSQVPGIRRIRNYWIMEKQLK